MEGIVLLFLRSFVCRITHGIFGLVLALWAAKGLVMDRIGKWEWGWGGTGSLGCSWDTSEVRVEWMVHEGPGLE
jgi:hypothetical protein